MKAVLASLLLLTACQLKSTWHEPEGPDAGTTAPDAAIDSPAGEPKPAFTVAAEISGQLALDDAGLRQIFTVDGQQYLSVVIVSLTETATQVHCGVTLQPTFVQFGSASTSTRQFKTAVIDFSTATIVEDKCHWDDAHILAGLAAQYGHYIVGFAQARFAEDRPYVDVYLDAQQPFPGSVANIVRAGGGAAYQMSADGTVTDSMVQPTPGTLLPALYDF